MAESAKHNGLFLRWFVVVYLPLGLLGALMLLAALGLLPRLLRPAVLLLAAWNVLGLRLLYERRKKGLKVKTPRDLVLWASLVAVIGGVGLTLFWVGAENLSSNIGFLLFLMGGFLMALAITLPLFKLFDAAIRGLFRAILGSKTADTVSLPSRRDDDLSATRRGA